MAAPAFIDFAQWFDEEDDAIEAAMGVEAHNRESSYKHFGYRPVTREQHRARLRVTGTLPADLSGVYLRNGTNTQFAETHVRLHCFNGAGMLHQVQLSHGEAFYSNTYIRTPVYEIERQAGREVFSVFSDIAGGGRGAMRKLARLEARKNAGRLLDLGPLETVQSSTAVQWHQGRIFCLAEVGLPFALNARLAADGALVIDGSGRFEDWGGRLRNAFSAHPRIDPATGDFYSVTVDRLDSAVSITHLSKGQLVGSRKVHQQDEQAPRMANLHDCFLTENFIVFADVSLRQAREWIAGPSGSIFRFDPARKLRWGVVPRDLGADTPVRWFETGQAGFIWHNINGWEQRGPDGADEIVLYAPMFHDYPDDLPIHTPEEPAARLHKWILNLRTGQVTTDRTLLTHGYERPSFNLGFTGQPSRFAYLLDEERGRYMAKGVLKYDLFDEKEIAYFDYGDFFGGEALFVAKSGATSEDDGYLLDILMAQEEAQLLILDAGTMSELARIHLPGRVPFGVHACWIDQAKLGALEGALGS